MMICISNLYKLVKQFKDFDIDLTNHIFYVLCIDNTAESLTTYVMIDMTMLSSKLHINEHCTYQTLTKFVKQHCNALQCIDTAEEVFVSFCKEHNLCMSYIDDEHLDMLQFWYLDKDLYNDDTANVIDGFGNVVPLSQYTIN